MTTMAPCSLQAKTEKKKGKGAKTKGYASPLPPTSITLASNHRHPCLELP